MKIAAIKRLEIGYEEFGDPTGLPVFLLHGFPDDAVRAWDGVIGQRSARRQRLGELSRNPIKKSLGALGPIFSQVSINRQTLIVPSQPIYSRNSK
jgi:hypothetical protein